MIEFDMFHPTVVRISHLISNAPEDQCIEWPAYRNKQGYGRTRIGRFQIMVTHVALALDGRLRPDHNMYALHSCDNPPCINPHHLRWGTKKENAADAMDRGRVFLAGLVGSGKERWQGRNAEQSRIRRASIEFVCPVCGSPRGQACPGAKGRRRGAIHRERMRLVSTSR